MFFEERHVVEVGRGVAKVGQGFEQAVKIPACRGELGVGRKEVAGKFGGFGRLADGLALGTGKFRQLKRLDFFADAINAGLGHLDGVAFGVGGEVEKRGHLSAAPAAAAGATGFRHLVEDVIESVVVGLFERIELVVVAAVTSEREAEPDGRGGLDAIEDIFDASLFGDAAALAVEHIIAVKTAGDFLVARGAGQKIAGELFDGELIEGHVRVQRIHHPIAPRPHRTLGVALEAVSIGVAREIEPVPSPAFAVAGRGEEALDKLFIGVGRAVGDKRSDFYGRGRQAVEVEAHAADEGGAVGLGGGSDFFRREPGENEGVDGISDRRGGSVYFGNDRTLRGREGPVLVPRGALGDPTLEEVFLREGERAVRFRRRHDLLGVGTENASNEFAVVGFAGDDGGGTGLGGGERAVAAIKAKFRFAGLAIGAVAVVAVFRQDGLDIALETDRRFGSKADDEGEQGDAGERKIKTRGETHGEVSDD